MPPIYFELGSLPRKRHIAHKHEPGYRDEGIYYEEVVTTAGFGRAYQHLLSPAAADARSQDRSRPARVAVETVDAAGAAASPPQDRQAAAQPAIRSPAGCRSWPTPT